MLREVNTRAALVMCTILLCMGLLGCRTPAEPVSQARVVSDVVITPASMARVGTVDERYQSYNVEMLEVTGGKFWKPYGPELDAVLESGRSARRPVSSGDTPAGMD